MTLLSVNVNKVAVLRNSRGGSEPDVGRPPRPACRPAQAGLPCIRGPISATSVQPMCAPSCALYRAC